MSAVKVSNYDIVVAAADASAGMMARADYVCDGTADEVEINAAITAAVARALPSGGYTIHGGRVLLVGQQFKIAAPIKLKTGVTLSGTAKSYTTIVAGNGTTMDSMIALDTVNVERTVTENLNLNGNVGGSAVTDGITLHSTGGSFGISPDAIHRIRHVDFRNGSGSAIILSGSTLRGSILYDIRIQGWSKHGVWIRSASSDHRLSQISVIACGTDDQTMKYSGFHLAAPISGYDGSGHVTFDTSTYSAGGSASMLSQCRADFQKGRGFMIDAARVNLQPCMSYDDWGPGLDLGPNSGNCMVNFYVNSAVFPVAGIEGSDSGVYVQGGFHHGRIYAMDRGFASGQTDALGNYGLTQGYGVRFRADGSGNPFSSGCIFDIVAQNTRIDSVIGSRAGTAGHSVRVSCAPLVSAVQYVNLPLATGGTFTLTFDDTGSNPQTTSAITWSGTAATLATNVQTALRALSNVGGSGVNVVASGNQSYQVQCTFAGSLANTPFNPMTVNGASLTGTGATAAASIIVRVNGGARTTETRHGKAPVYMAVPQWEPPDNQIQLPGITFFEDPTGSKHLFLKRKHQDTTISLYDLDNITSPPAVTPVVSHQPGYLYAAYDSAIAQSNGTTTGTTLTLGRLQLTRIDVDGYSPITDLDLIVTSIASVGTLSNCYVAVHDPSGAQLYLSPDQSTAWGSTGLKTVSPGITPLAGFVWVVLLANSTSSGPTFLRVSHSVQAAMLGILNTTTTARGAHQGTGLTTIADPLVPASNALDPSLIWAGAR